MEMGKKTSIFLYSDDVSVISPSLSSTMRMNGPIYLWNTTDFIALLSCY